MILLVLCHRFIPINYFVIKKNCVVVEKRREKEEKEIKRKKKLVFPLFGLEKKREHVDLT